MNQNPLISVAVLSYNSSPFVVETLESIKKQTYNNIELIISDDASTDNTIAICEDWLVKNSLFFKNTILVKSKNNTGVSGNANRALEKANGEWIKIIAADDYLSENALNEYYNYSQLDFTKNVIFSDYISFVDDGGSRKFKEERLPYRKVFFGENVTPQKQFSILLKNFVGYGPTLFIKTKILKSIGFDERFPLQEDYSLFISLTKKGHKMNLLPQHLVYYRVNPLSITKQGTTNCIWGNSYRRVIMDYKCLYRYENMNFFWKLMMIFSLFLHRMVFNTGNRRDSIICRFCYYMQRVLDPFRWYNLGLKIIDKII